MESEVRLGRIFSLLESGVGSAEIIRIENERRKPYLDRLNKGISSEQNVSDSLVGLPAVTGINRVPAYSIGDKNGIDIVVALNRDIPGIVVSKIRVQVKSSEWGIAKFRKKIKSDNSLSEDEVDDWLTRNGWVVLNGQNASGEIANSFLAQLRKINNFATTSETVADRDDLKNRMKDQARRYLDHLRNGTLTLEWKAWGRKHALEIAKLVY